MRQKLGQHFLQDHKIIEKIVDQVLLLQKEKAGLRLLEIGPGRGALTQALLNRESSLRQRLCLIEKDQNLADYWSHQGLQVLPGDFLEMDASAWLSSDGLLVFSNLPYYAATAILLRLSQQYKSISAMVLMFQAEVGKRLRASASTADRGSLSIWTQNLWNVSRLLQVPPRAFKPPPKVQSEVLVLRPRPSAMIAGSETNLELLEKLLKTCFAHRRKMLRSGLPPGYWREVLQQSQVDGTLRAEALDWPQWQKLFDAAVEHKK